MVEVVRAQGVPKDSRPSILYVVCVADENVCVLGTVQ